MAKAKVWHMDARGHGPDTNLVSKLLHLWTVAGFNDMIKPGDKVAIKMHLGAWDTTRYLRPVYPRVLVDRIRELGGDPYIIECTAIWGGTYFDRRHTAEDYLFTAARNGFHPATVNAPIVIADGEWGLDDIVVDLPEGVFLKEQYIGAKVPEADVLIVLTHFKGHPLGVFGGSVKNIGVGLSSKRGKLHLHLSDHPRYGMGGWDFHPERCVHMFCPLTPGGCMDRCPVGALRITPDGVHWDKDKCISCFLCPFMCPKHVWETPHEFWAAHSVAFTDSAKAVLKLFDKDKVGFINMALDVAPACDCMPWADLPIVPDQGIFVSKDILAVDEASLDMVRHAQGAAGSVADEAHALAPGIDKFTRCATPFGVSERIQAKVGEANGLGCKDYELIKVGTPSMVDLIGVGAFGSRQPQSPGVQKFYTAHPIITPERNFKQRVKDIPPEFLIYE
ncbi:MAG: DUF362 domain-containing protein [Chloroflexota bacterium]|nr:DUF362 domain-containing protein [Chloroflexota bacterium]